MDVIIIKKKSIKTWIIISLLFFIISFCLGYFVGKQEREHRHNPYIGNLLKTEPYAVQKNRVVISQEESLEKDTTETPLKAEEEKIENDIDTNNNTENQIADTDTSDNENNEDGPATTPETENKTKTKTESTPAPETEENPKKNTESKPKTEQEPKQENSTAIKGFTIQVGAFADENNAKRYLNKLKDKGYKVSIYTETETEKRLPISVRVGFYKGYNKALEEAKRFEEAESRPTMVVNAVKTEITEQ